MKFPLVSIIVPVFNVEKYINHCIESVIAQTFKNWECIIIDDGSTDRTGWICDEYANKDGRIEVLHIENSGPSIARNYGLNIAKGKYIYFLDSDDFIDPCLFEKVVSEMEFGYDIVSFNYIREDLNGNVIRHSDFLPSQYEFREIEESLKFLCLRFLHYNYGWEGWNRFFRNDIIKKHNLQFFPKSKIGEDMLFCVMYLTHSKSYKILEDEVYHYIKHEGTLLDKSKINDNLKTFLDMFHVFRLHIAEHTKIAKAYCPAILMIFLHIEISNLRMKKKTYKEISERMRPILDKDTRLLLHSFITEKINKNIVGEGYYYIYCYEAFLFIKKRSYIELLAAKVYYQCCNFIMSFKNFKKNNK